MACHQILCICMCASIIICVYFVFVCCNRLLIRVKMKSGQIPEVELIVFKIFRFGFHSLLIFFIHTFRLKFQQPRYKTF